MVATVSDHSEAYKSSVKVGGVLVSVDGDREFTIHSSVEARWQAEVRMECPSTTCGFSSRAVAPCGVKDSSAIVDEGLKHPDKSNNPSTVQFGRRAVFSTALSSTKGQSIPTARMFQSCTCGFSFECFALVIEYTRFAKAYSDDCEIRHNHCLSVRGIHKGEGVRTVGRLQPGQAGERLLKTMPKKSARIGRVDIASTTLVCNN